MKSAFVLIASLATILAACSSSAPPPETTAPIDATQPPKPLPKSNVFSSDINALNKAKNVQNIVNQQKQKLDKAVDDSGG